MAETLPAFLRDFHDQKDFVKAFWSWLEMMDKMQEIDNGRKFDQFHKRRTDMANWPEFQILFISCIDFMNQVGYRVQRKPGFDNAEFERVKRDLKDLPLVFDSIRNPDEILQLKESYCYQVLGRWKNWWRLFPEDIRDYCYAHADEITKDKN